jgi:hypothetical protein
MNCVCDPTGFLEPISDAVVKARIATLEQTCGGLPAAPKKGEHIAHLFNSTGSEERDDRA